MNVDHNFNVGQPDNLVFIKEFLDKIEAKLEQLVCLYCEKVFKSRDVLKELSCNEDSSKILGEGR